MARRRKRGKFLSSGTQVLFMVLGLILGGLIIIEALSQVLFKSSLSGTNYIVWDKERDQNKAHYSVKPIEAVKTVIKASPIWQSPANTSMKVGSLTPKERVQVTGKLNANDILWYEIIRFDGRPGYVPVAILSK